MLIALGYISLCSLRLTAQSGTYQSKGIYEDYFIPNNATGYIALTAVGGGGGVKRFDNGIKDFKVAAGEGAYVKAWFEIGTGENQLKPGSTLRFIVGGRGADFHSAGSSGGGGGGGTGIVYRDILTHEWELLVVAGGGSGSGFSITVNRLYGAGGTAYATGNEGDGKGGFSLYESSAGAGAYVGDIFANGVKAGVGMYAEAGWPDQEGDPTGGRSLEEYVKGGWGFGAGGDGSRSSAHTGGGGGYSGGDVGTVTATQMDPSGGGTSYVNEDFALNFFSVGGATSTATHAGHAGYEYTADIALPTIKLAKDPTKCLHVTGGKAAPGTNVQLWDCNGGTAENWVFTGSMVKFAKDNNQCLEIQGSNPYNGANVELWTCNTGTNAQKWIYDGVKGLIRSAANPDKCLDLVNGQTFNGNNIQIWDCKSIGAQQWIMDRATFSSAPPIRLISNSKKCIHTRDGWMGEGAWLELWDCMGTTAQQWVLEDNQIKPVNNTGRCVTIKNADDTNGTQLLLWNCYGDDHQQWVYDGVKRLIRSKKNLNKCFALSSNSNGNGTLIQLMECNTGDTQQWQIDGATTSPTDERVQTIRPAYATNKCFHTKAGSTANGANVELWDCLGTEAQEWYFIGSQIKFNGNHDKCLTLPVGDMTNGTNIFLEDCSGGYRQEWIYDGLTKSIRSGKNLSKCIHIRESSSANGANVELWNCLGTEAQQFEIN